MLGFLDEFQSLNILLGVEPVARLRARGFRQQMHQFVVANRLCREPCCFCQLTYFSDL